MEKSVIVIIGIIILMMTAGYIYDILTYLFDMFFARSCLIDSMDAVIRLLKFQQVILSEVGIPVHFSMNRQIFTRDIKEVHKAMTEAYIRDYKKCSLKLSPEYAEAQQRSYIDNINAINLALLDYDSNNVRYSNDCDHIPILGMIMPRYQFLDNDIAFRKDNGLEGTSAIGGSIQ